MVDTTPQPTPQSGLQSSTLNQVVPFHKHNNIDAPLIDANNFTLSNITNGIGYTPENVANKVTTITGVSDINYPSEKAVATYVAGNTHGLGSWSSAGGGSPPNASYSGTASSDGFICACLSGTSGGSSTNGYILGETPTGTTRFAASSSIYLYMSITMPVKNGNSWKVSQTSQNGGTVTLTIYFIPLT